MNTASSRAFDKTNAAVALGVLAVTLTVYTLTKAPTLSLWDCGEFIAACYGLGIPHPPGYPLYTIIGRIFSVLAPFGDIAVRVNFLSSFSNAFAAFFGYLATVRILRLWYGEDRSTYSRLLMYGGGAAGAFFMAFGFTQWSNSVEAEVYGLTMLLFMLVLWLTLKYFESGGQSSADRYMILATYIAAIGIGVHLTAFMIFVVSGVVFMLHRDTPARYWFMTGAFFVLELYLVFALSSGPDEVPYYVPIIIVGVFYAFYVFSFDRIPRALLLIGAGFLLAIAPVYALLVAAVKKNAAAVPPATSTPAYLSWIGATALVALTTYAVWTLIRYRRRRDALSEPDRLTAVASLFVLVAAAMTVILVLNVRGYVQFLLASAVMVIILVALLRRYIRWPVLIAVTAISLVIVNVWPFVIGMVVAVAAIIILGVSFRMPSWKTAIAMIAVAIAGYSIHVYLPVRSSQSPVINQSNPSAGLTTTINLLERKQYGSQSMIDRMFARRGEWQNQFGNSQRMGFWRFFDEQYGLRGPRFFILFVVGLFGVWEVVRRRPPVGTVFLIALLLTSVGLVLYMNFADGTRGAHMEVRDRDYFFTPFFVLFGLAIGMGLTMFIQFVRDSMRSVGAAMRKPVLAVLPALFLLPWFAYGGNHFRCDRSRNYVAYEYARDILISADPDAVLFTGGDNDTFPLWCLQDVYRIRTDVAIVCLPLANADWYIKQLRDDMGLQLGWTDDQIENLVPYRLPNGLTFRVQDQVIDAVMNHERAVRPVNFAITVGPGSRRYKGYEIDSLMEQRGMVFHVKDSGSAQTADVEKSLRLYESADGFGYRGFGDPGIYKDETGERAIGNVVNAILTTVDYIRKSGRLDLAEQTCRFLLEKVPGDKEVVQYLADLYTEQDKVAELRALATNPAYADMDRVIVLYARALRKTGEVSQAEIVLQGLLKNRPDSREAFEELGRLYVSQHQYGAIERLFIEWLAVHPNDQRVRQMLQGLQRRSLPNDQDTQGG